MGYYTVLYKYGKYERMFGTILPLALVKYKMIIVNSALYASLTIYHVLVVD